LRADYEGDRRDSVLGSTGRSLGGTGSELKFQKGPTMKKK